MEEQLNTGQQTDTVVDDGQMQSQGNENSQQLTEEQIVEEQGQVTDPKAATKWKPGDPFNQHPDWLKREQKLQDLEARLQEFEAQKVDQPQQNVQQEDSSLAQLEDIPDDRLAPLLENLPQRTFEGKTYNTMAEFYADVRNNLIKDMALLERNAQTQTQAQVAQMELQNKQIVAQVQKSFGEDKDSFRQFVEWTEKLEKSENAEDRSIAELPYDKQAAIYRQYAGKQGQSGSKKNLKAAGKIAGSSNVSPTSSYDEFEGLTLNQSYELLAKQKGN